MDENTTYVNLIAFQKENGIEVFFVSIEGEIDTAAEHIIDITAFGYI